MTDPEEDKQLQKHLAEYEATFEDLETLEWEGDRVFGNLESEKNTDETN